MNCKYCGRFTGKRDYSWIRWGGSAEFTQPEPTYAHRRCMPQEDVDYYSNPKNAWIPIRLEEGEAKQS